MIFYESPTFSILFLALFAIGLYAALKSETPR
jgi:hypothetical protein